MDEYISLFSGIGGLDLAVEALGYRCVGQVEWDEHCTRVLARHWPDVPRWSDIHDFTAASYAERKPVRNEGRGHDSRSHGAHVRAASTDVLVADRRAKAHGPSFICGGFPCQPASTAGKRKGTADSRWLWPEFARVIGELEPRHVLVENVPGLLTVNGGRAFSEVLGTLADLGYDATWTSLRAADVGAPHRRERIFLLARRAADTEDDGGQRSQVPRRRGSGAARGDRAFPWGAYEPAIRRWEQVMGCAPHPIDDKGRLAPAFVEWMQGFPAGWTEGMSRTQALKALGNAVVNQQARAALSSLMTLERVA